jgi:hypothetical protein
MKLFIVLVFASLLNLSTFGKDKVLFSGLDLNAFDLKPGSWEIEKDGSVVCRMEKIKDKKGVERLKGMGFLWTQKKFSNFSLRLDYKLSEGANSGIFYRSNPEDPVQEGFEIQLMDNEGFQKKAKKILPPRKLNASFYDGVAPRGEFSNPVGQWNQAELICKGPQVSFSLNSQLAFSINLDDWKEAGQNPDGTTNKFKTALKDLPRTGHIGFQNHGQVVWFKNIKIKKL